jgi:23S rRNA pseudouridine1911/1915/1917 synthase
MASHRAAGCDHFAVAPAACRVVFEDESLLVVDKPSGLLATPTAEPDRPSVEALLAAREPDLPIRAVHRLDRLASGLLLLAKTPDATRSLARQIAARTVRREYAAVVAGRFPDDRRTVAHPIGGRAAVTHVATVERFGSIATKVRCRLETGRTHQIRIHARTAGHPVLGDRVHGTPTPVDPPRLALPAASLAFVHPRTHAHVTFESAWPGDLAAWLAALRHGAPVELPTGPGAL